MSIVDRFVGEVRLYLHTQFPDRKTLLQKGRGAASLLGIFIVLYIAGMFFPVGFDWEHFFGQGRYPEFWMPWTKAVVEFLDYPSIFALTILSLGWRVYRNKPSLRVLLAALFFTATSPITLWMLHLGNVDGLAMFGLMILPLGVPLVLIKPQVAAFAMLAKRSSLIFAVVWLLLSFVIWGFWPVTWLKFFTPEWDMEWVQDIALFPWGLIPAAILMWFSQGDEDLLMAAGSLASPHLFLYHFIVLMPSLSRMRYLWMFAAWVGSFLFLLANWYGDWAWHLGNLMSFFFWFGIYFSMPPEKRPKPGLPDWLPLKFARPRPPAAPSATSL